MELTALGLKETVSMANANGETSNLVLLPGINNTGKVWSQIVENLPSDIHYYTPDVPPLEDIDQIAETLLEDLPDCFHLCGFSFGGYVALAMFAMAPERIAGLSLIGSLPYEDTEQQKKARMEGIKRAKSGGYEEMVLAQSHIVFHKANLNNPEIEQNRRENINGYGVERYISHQKACMNRPNRLHLLENLDIPFLMLSGDNDIVVPTNQQEELANQLNARFETISTAGHMAPLENPSEIAQKLIPWLKEKGRD